MLEIQLCQPHILGTSASSSQQSAADPPLRHLFELVVFERHHTMNLVSQEPHLSLAPHQDQSHLGLETGRFHCGVYHYSDTSPDAHYPRHPIRCDRQWRDPRTFDHPIRVPNLDTESSPSPYKGQDRDGLGIVIVRSRLLER